MGNKREARRLRLIIDSLHDELEQMDDDLIIASEVIGDYRVEVESLEGMLDESLQGWREVSVAAGEVLDLIKRSANVDPLGDEFAIVYLDSPSVEVLKSVVLTEPNALEPDDSHAFAYAPYFDVDYTGTELEDLT